MEQHEYIIEPTLFENRDRDSHDPYLVEHIVRMNDDVTDGDVVDPDLTRKYTRSDGIFGVFFSCST